MIDLPDYKEIIDRSRADLAQNLPNIDPTIFGSYVRGIVDSQSGRSFDIVLLMEQLIKELFPQTASGDFLELVWAGYEGLTRNAATASSGPVAFTGTAGSIIPANTQWSYSNGDLYETEASLTLAAQTISISSMTRSGTTVTATTTSDHSLGTSQQGTIAGAVETDYNGLQTITVTAANKFTYEITGTPTTPATGTITFAYEGGSVDVESVGTGQDKNLDSGAQLALSSPIAGVDATAIVQFAELGGGTDVETDDELLVRVLQSRSNPVANFNPAAIEKAARTVPGVTRVKVKRITPRIGAVTILFVRDNDTNIIPSASEVADVKAVIDALLPATSDTTDVVVTAPTPVITDYDFTTISPDTTTMRSAIEANLQAFYEDEATFEVDITADKYKAAIINTIDPETGETLDSFTLNAPVGDITIGTDSIGVLGNLIF